MTIIKEIFEESDYRPESILPQIPFQQAFWYGEMQKRRGRDVKRYLIERDGIAIGCAQFVVYPLFMNLNYWYSAYGPVLIDQSDDTLKEIEEKLRIFASESSAVFARLDFTPMLSEDGLRVAQNIFTKSSKSSSSGSYFQPRHEWYTDISKSPDEILSAMHQKTRYSVRYAKKKGITTAIISGANLPSQLESFLSLMKETGRRNSFALHDDNYYKCFFDEIAKTGRGFIVEAKLNQELLAAHFIVMEGDVAHYAFGGSSNHKKDLCAPYLTHFEGMIEAKARGATSYNFGGISRGEDAPHWESITSFKKKFGGRAVSHSSYFDIVIKPIWYYLYVFRKLLKSFV